VPPRRPTFLKRYEDRSPVVTSTENRAGDLLDLSAGSWGAPQGPSTCADAISHKNKLRLFLDTHILKCDSSHLSGDRAPQISHKELISWFNILCSCRNRETQKTNGVSSIQGKCRGQNNDACTVYKSKLDTNTDGWPDPLCGLPKKWLSVWIY